MKVRDLIIAALVLALVTAGPVPVTSLAQADVTPGEKLPDMNLVRPAGGVESYLGPPESEARVFAFVKADHERSRHLLGKWAGMQGDLADQPVHWVLIVSDRQDPARLAAWDSLAPGSTILIDAGDVLYGQLGVALVPTVGIADKDGILRALLPFHQINYSQVILAHTRRVLGLISDRELEELLDPHGGVADSLLAGARRKLKLGRILLDRGRTEAALSQVESALADCPDLREGYLLLEQVHLTAGRKTEAARAAARAEALAASLVDAQVDTAVAATAFPDSSGR